MDYSELRSMFPGLELRDYAWRTVRGEIAPPEAGVNYVINRLRSVGDEFEAIDVVIDHHVVARVVLFPDEWAAITPIRVISGMVVRFIVSGEMGRIMPRPELWVAGSLIRNRPEGVKVAY